MSSQKGADTLPGFSYEQDENMLIDTVHDVQIVQPARDRLTRLARVAQAIPNRIAITPSVPVR
jgi:hypothetical protein